MPYVPLQVFGQHSLQRGIVSPAEWVKHAAERGLVAMALTDRHSVMGSVEFFRAARSAGIRPLIGTDFDRDKRALTALARGPTGLEVLHRAIGALHARPGTEWWEVLAAGASDLVVLVEDPDLLPEALGTFGGSLRAAVVRLPGHNPFLTRRTAHALGIRCVAAGRAHFRDEEDWKLHRVLAAVAGRTTLTRLSHGAVEPPRAILEDDAGMRRRHAGEEDLLRETEAVADLCSFDLELGRPRLPGFHLPDGLSAPAYLGELARNGLAKVSKGPVPAAAAERLERELAMIVELGFAGYFLIVREIVEFAKGRGIPFVGRGSAANSLVVHALGITPVNPLEHDLVFERFLTPSRRSLPDIDVDFCWRRRDEVIGHVYRCHGKDRVATISTHVAWKTRSAFRETAKAMGWAEAAIREASRTLPETGSTSLREAADEIPEARRWARRTPGSKEALSWADRLRGLPRHLGMHPGGIVISDRPLTRDTALVPSAKGPLVTQHEMRAIEALGLVKIDLLGQRSLSTIEDVRRSLLSEGIAALDIAAGSGRDPDVSALLQRGQTLGCFQIESPGMRRLLTEMGAKSRIDVIDAISLIRPGPASAGMKDAYIRRVRGEEPASSLHPLTDEVLRRTHGIMLYQEDILRVCEALSGWSLEQGDLLRAALGKKKDPGLIANLRERYLEGAAARGVPAETAESIWTMIGRFAAFSYCKAHAAVYGHLAYAEALLKSRYPAAFFAAVLNNHRGYYPDRVYVEEALRLGVTFLLPDMNRSARGFSLEKGTVRIGLASIRSLQDSTLDRWEEERARGGPFFSLRDLMERVRPDRREARHLILAGALDGLDRSRPEWLWRLELLLKEPARSSDGGLFPDRGPEPVLPRLPDYPEAKKRKLEFALLGFVAESASSVFGRAPGSLRIVAAADLARFAGRQVACFGWCSATRRARTSDGRHLRFITLEDPTGPIEGVFFPEAYQRLGHRILGEGPYIMRGRVEVQHDAVCVHVSDFEICEQGAGALSVPSLQRRDPDVEDLLADG